MLKNFEIWYSWMVWRKFDIRSIWAILIALPAIVIFSFPFFNLCDALGDGKRVSLALIISIVPGTILCAYLLMGAIRHSDGSRNFRLAVDEAKELISAYPKVRDAVEPLMQQANMTKNGQKLHETVFFLWRKNEGPDCYR
jgi:hypothetical protein